MGLFPLHLQDIVAGSHPFRGLEGRVTLTDLLHVFPAPGYPVTGRTQVVRHEI